MRATLVAIAVSLTATAARADTGKPAARAAPPVGLTLVYQFTPDAGFVDDPIASDAGRVAFVVADTAGTAALHVIDTAGTQLAPPIDLATVTVAPSALAFVGDRVLVIGAAGDAQVAALVDLAGKVIYKTPAVAHAALISVGGKPRLALHAITQTATGTHHALELRAPDTGKKIGKPRTLDLDADGKSAKLDFRINHWTTGWTHAIGIKAGTWNKAEDQQSPDVEATYDLATGKFIAQTDIVDVLAQRKRFAVLAAEDGRDAFVRTKEDLSELELWQGGQRTVVALDQPLLIYGDPRRSLDLAFAPGGAAWLALQVDPVNVEAVKRKKADLEYWDLYAVEGGKATRKARLYAGSARLRFGWAGDKLWVLDRNIGFDRGGKSLAFYTLP